METNNSWLHEFKKELDKTLNSGTISSESGSLFLDTALITAQKLEKHSKKCSKCQELKSLFLEYLIDLQNLKPEAFFHQAERYKLKTLKRKKCDIVHEHLKNAHHYKGVMDNRISYIFIGLFLTICLLIINSFIDFGWHWLFSFPLLTLAWLIGYTLDKRNKKKGWVI